MAKRTKKQHLVPRFYLENFCDSDGKVWTYSSGRAAFPKPPLETAVETNFYSPNLEKGGRFDDAESMLEIIETAAAPLWSHLMSGQVLLGEDREKIAIFLAAQYLRSPAVISAAAEMMAHELSHYSRAVASNKETHDNTIDEYELAVGKKISPEERENMREFVTNTDKYSLDVKRDIGLPVLAGIGDLGKIIMEMKWVVGRSKNQHLITCDSPVTRISDPKTHHPFFGDGAFANKTVRVTFPLSSSRILEITWQGEERDRVVEIPKQMAREMNLLRAKNAERFLYANQKDSGISRLCDKWLIIEKPPKIVSTSKVPKINVKRKL